LIGRDTGELRLLDELRQRIANAQADIGVPDPLDDASGDAAGDAVSSDTIDVSAEVMRLRLAHLLKTRPIETGRPLVTTARNRKTRARLGRRTLRLWEWEIENGRETVVASQLIACVGDEPIMPESETWRREATASACAFATTGIAREEAVVRALENTGGSAIQPGLFDRRAHFAHAAAHAAHDETLTSHRERLAVWRLVADLSATAPRLRLVLAP
jgi:hypothetical protein